MGSYRGCFLSLMGAVYFWAFLSYYVQYQGLLGEDGLLPARQFWEEIRKSRLKQVRMDEPLLLDFDVALGWWTRGLAGGAVRLPAVELVPKGEAKTLRAFLQFPTWLWFLCDGRPSLQVDQALEGIALGGVLLAALAALGVHHVAVFALLFANYLTLYLLGQRWLGFQWDIFLLETGAMLLLYCPFTSLRAKDAMPPAAWLLRALIAKFMYMNGVVKVWAECPTWLHLTALEYHFASTCIPTAEAWTLHQLPPLVLRLMTAAMFVIEIAAPWLLLVPVRAVRQVGVFVQAALQLGILATGNYNWFNLHTMILLIPAWDDDDFGDSCHGPLLLRALTWLPRLWDRAWASTLGSLFAAVGACCTLAWAAWAMFAIAPVADKRNPLELADLLQQLPSALLDPGAAASALASDRWLVQHRRSDADYGRLTDAILSSRCLTCFFALVGASCLRYVVAPLSQASERPASPCLAVVIACCRSLGRLAVSSMVIPLLVVCLLPFEHARRGSTAGIPFAGAGRALDEAFGPWQVATGYGLFRRMTGVGKAPRGSTGWGGLPPSVVEVPAVAVEGSVDGVKWTEIPFRYTPGKPTRQPRRTAPHQPRLDWQMWFAALGSYQHNPWFVHLLYKILEGSNHTLSLLDVDESPWPSLEQRPKFVRAWLYHYDFTRLDTPWARSVPGARVLNVSQGADVDQWWTRSKAREYVPAASKDALEEVVRKQGWPTGTTRREAALRRAANCTGAHRRGVAFGGWCEGVLVVRRLVEPLQRSTGVAIRSNVLRRVWPGASNLFFVDVHFVLMLAPLAAILGLRCLGALLCSRRPRERGVAVPTLTGKVKKE